MHPCGGGPTRTSVPQWRAWKMDKGHFFGGSRSEWLASGHALIQRFTCCYTHADGILLSKKRTKNN